MTFIVPIVEGHGEVEALPILIRRIARHGNVSAPPKVSDPFRVRAASFLNDPACFAKYIGMAAHKAAPCGGTVLILLDCEDDCPATLGPALLGRAKAIRGDVAFFVALAYREFESWFMFASQSLGGSSGFATDIQPPTNAEAIRDAKGWLSRYMPTPYDPVQHQHEFAKRLDLDAAQASDSFRRLYRHVLCLASP